MRHIDAVWPVAAAEAAAGPLTISGGGLPLYCFYFMAQQKWLRIIVYQRTKRSEQIAVRRTQKTKTPSVGKCAERRTDGCVRSFHIPFFVVVVGVPSFVCVFPSDTIMWHYQARQVATIHSLYKDRLSESAKHIKPKRKMRNESKTDRRTEKKNTT